jgi:hypothetical protein
VRQDALDRDRRRVLARAIEHEATPDLGHTATTEKPRQPIRTKRDVLFCDGHF